MCWRSSRMYLCHWNVGWARILLIKSISSKSDHFDRLLLLTKVQCIHLEGWNNRTSLWVLSDINGDEFCVCRLVPLIRFIIDESNGDILLKSLSDQSVYVYWLFIVFKWKIRVSWRRCLLVHLHYRDRIIYHLLSLKGHRRLLSVV